MPRTERCLLYVDPAYTVENMRRRKHEQFFLMRHSGGYFRKVWGVHPLADRGGASERGIVFHEITPDQTVIEGPAELYRMPRPLLPLNFLLSQRKLFRTVLKVIEREGVDVIAATDPLYAGLFAWFLKRASGRPLIIHVLGHYDDIYEASGALGSRKIFRFRWVEKAVIRFVLRRADLTAPGTATLLDYCIRNGADPEKAAVFPVSKNLNRLHFVPPEERGDADAALARLNIPLGRPYLLSVSRLLPEKHVDHALQAMKIVMDRHPEAIGLFAGEGWLRPKLEEMATQMGIRDKIMFLGLVDQETLAQIIPRCITLSPLTGMALFETSLGASPAVAYDRDSQVAALVRDGETGFLVDFLDYKTMGARAIELIENPDMRRRMAGAIRQCALSQADPDILYRHEAEAFDRMFAQIGARGGGGRGGRIDTAQPVGCRD